eukprot:scaffold675685_cov98-Prasinocladus_malaysianus.AAC.1
MPLFWAAVMAEASVGLTDSAGATICEGTSEGHYRAGQAESPAGTPQRPPDPQAVHHQQERQAVGIAVPHPQEGAQVTCPVRLAPLQDLICKGHVWH